MNSKKSYITVGIVIVLIVLLVLVFYVLLHADSTPPSSFSLRQYLNGLAQAAMDKEAMATTTTMVATTSAITTPLPISVPASAEPTAQPFITILTPSTGTSDLTVIIGGGNFDHTVNYISFGPYDGRHSINGLPDNVVAAEGSPNGTTLTFNVPLDSPNGLLCDSTGKNCTAVAPVVLPNGAYAVTVKTDAGVSNQAWFTLQR